MPPVLCPTILSGAIKAPSGPIGVLQSDTTCCVFHLFENHTGEQSAPNCDTMSIECSVDCLVMYENANTNVTRCENDVNQIRWKQCRAAVPPARRSEGTRVRRETRLDASSQSRSPLYHPSIHPPTPSHSRQSIILPRHQLGAYTTTQKLK